MDLKRPATNTTTTREGSYDSNPNNIHGNLYDNELSRKKKDSDEDRSSISSEESADTRKARKGSLAKDAIEKKSAVFISFDLEHGGPKCGITQLSAVLFYLGGIDDTTMKHDIVMRSCFNEYVKPPSDAEWNPKCRETTGLHPAHPSIVAADPIDMVWNRFIEFLNNHVKPEQRGILVAWNGASCDLDWIYRLTQAPGSQLSFPSRVKYFLDPFRAIESTAGCKLNKKTFKITIIQSWSSI